MADESLARLIQNYHEGNPAFIDELPALPNALDFMRHVARNRPFVVRNGASHWTAMQRWDSNYLRHVMRGKQVKVAITPLGNADSVIENDENALLFVEPYQRDEDFSEFLDYILEDTALRHTGTNVTRNVKYAQTQNDNLRDEYQVLFSDVPPTIAFANEALQQDPDAINFWLGNGRTTTALHKDNYENIYVHIRGQKHFTLLPPVEMPCVNETLLPRADYRPSSPEEQRLVVHSLADAEPVPVAIWDPDEPDHRPSAYSHLSEALRVTLDEGDLLYLPAMWYHKVEQSSGEEGFACSVNYWYDMDYTGSLWNSQAFLRDILNAKAKVVEYPGLEIDTNGELDKLNITAWS